ncbi:MAG: glycogen/starch synthase [Spirochaetaceae bacterium]|nr:glycogen/starch synthase [Spirochaetaceae bacterium]
MNPDTPDRRAAESLGTRGGPCLTVPFGAEVDDAAVKVALHAAFREQRAFAFAPRAAWQGADAGERQRLAAAVRADAVAAAAPDSPAARERLQRDARLMQRLASAVRLTHELLMAHADGGSPAGAPRRVVLIRELPGTAFVFELGATAVLARVGEGPVGARVPTIYLGLRLFDLVAAEQDAAGAAREALGLILRLEERAIETGYSHVETVDDRHRATLERLYRALREPALGFVAPEQELPVPRRPVRVTAARRQAFLRQLNARRADSPLDFDAAICTAAMRSLERLAQRAKRHGDAGTRREVVRLLVAAAGHDLHEVRNHANLLLERMLAPKEFDAPLARTFANVTRGATHRFSLDLPPRRGRYLVRVYRGAPHHRYPGEADIRYDEVELRPGGPGQPLTARYSFGELGHYDYCVVRVHASGRREWLKDAACSGRINVIPDLRGELALQIFPDIHGHTRTWWGDGEHPGLVYNEHGEVIRLGTFADVAAHLPHIRRRHGFSIVYLLGVQKRGSNREDWSPHATSASPFAPESLVEMEPRLGGNDGLRELVEAAHELGMKVVVDVIPHLNRRVHDVPESFSVRCFDDAGNLVPRASTDGRYGSWNDGVLLNYRRLAVWEWLAGAVRTLVERFDVDGVRCDIAHALPVVMKRNNASTLPSGPRSDEDQVEGTIVVNEREDDHLITTGFFDSACRDLVASPLHYLLMRELEQATRGCGKDFSLFLAESYWGREQYLSRVGVVPYNSALFKICERVAQGTSPVSEIYHLYDDHYRHALPPGTELMGMFGNHDERRPVNTFGRDNLRPVLTLTSFLTNLLLDYEGNAEGEAWKVFADNVYVDWNRFDSAADRSVERVFSEAYAFHRRNPGRGTLVPTDHEQVVAVIKPAPRGLWLAVCSFSADSAMVSVDLSAAEMIDDAARYVVVDPTYSPVTRGYAHYTGRELRVTPLTTSVSYRQRVKLLRIDLDAADADAGSRTEGGSAKDLLRDSFDRLLVARSREQVTASYAYRALAEAAADRERLARFLDQTLLPLYDPSSDEAVALGLKRALYHAHRDRQARSGAGPDAGLSYLRGGAPQSRAGAPQSRAGKVLVRALALLRSRPLVFVSAEAEPFSKSGGLANVTFELPRELARLGESMYVITPLYRTGERRAVGKMRDAVARFGVSYTGVNVHFRLGNEDFEVGVHRGEVEGVTYFLLDHHELFDGLYWGYRSNERIRRRLALGRAAAEVMMRFRLHPQVVATNDAAASLVSGIVRGDPYYAGSAAFADTGFVHIIHNGGWQYFDCYDRYEEGADLFGLFNLPFELAPRFTDPRNPAQFNLMAAGIRFADRVFTVSPTYARQIERDCDGLEGLLHDVVGINNGIGKDFRRGVGQRLARSGLERRHAASLKERIDADRALRDKLGRRFPELLGREGEPVRFRSQARRDEVFRMRTKLLAQIEYGLTVDPDRVLYVMIHRVSDQKGFQILLDASQGIFRDLGVQAILGGPIAPNDHRAEQLAAGMRALMEYYPGSVAARIGYQEISLPLLAADAFLMPSEFEPGGISQLEAMSCGCIVVAHATGGLRDTVTPLHVSGASVRGCGVLFGDYHAGAFLDAMARCTWFFRHATASQIRRARNNARRSIVWWDRAAQRYQQELHALKETVPSSALQS